MRKQTAEDIKRIQLEEDLLTGNIKRMCSTDSFAELEIMAKRAIERIQRIQYINYYRLSEKE